MLIQEHTVSLVKHIKVGVPEDKSTHQLAADKWIWHRENLDAQGIEKSWEHSQHEPETSWTGRNEDPASTCSQSTWCGQDECCENGSAGSMRWDTWYWWAISCCHKNHNSSVKQLSWALAHNVWETQLEVHSQCASKPDDLLDQCSLLHSLLLDLLELEGHHGLLVCGQFYFHSCIGLCNAVKV